MKFFVILLSDIKSATCENDFKNFVDRHKLEWWRYTPLNWILATPDTMQIHTIAQAVADAYGLTVCSILQVNIEDFAGVYAQNPKGNGNPFDWFFKLRQKAYIPRWEQ